MWESPDPALGAYLGNKGAGVHQPSNLSSFAYVHQNPLKLVDPTGQQVGEAEPAESESLTESEVRGEENLPMRSPWVEIPYPGGTRYFNIRNTYGSRFFTQGEMSRVVSYELAAAAVRRMDPKFNAAVGPEWGNIPSRDTVTEIEAYRRYLEGGGAPGVENFNGAPRGVVVGPIENAVGNVAPPPGAVFGTTTFGNAIHQGWEAMMRRDNPGTEFEFRVMPGQTGVDARWISGPNPFAPYENAELKPMSLSGARTFGRQAERWGLQGNVRPYYYDWTGSIYRGNP